MKPSLIIKPRMSEKSYELSEAISTYVFEVPKSASKQEIADAVAKQYGVKVAKVRVASTAGKTRRVVKRSGRSVQRGYSSSVRKAYVRLGPDDKLPIFASVAKDEEEMKAQDKKQEKKANKATAPTESKKTTISDQKTAQDVSKPEKRGRRFGLNIRGNR